VNKQFKAISALRWTLGMVVLLESVHFVFSTAAAHHFAQTGLSQWIRPALGASEIVAILLFLTPGGRLIGGYALLLIFAIAAAIHFLRGQFDVGSLIVYSMAVIVCMVQNKGPIEVPLER
jgi:hypothetical protein